VGVLRSYKTPSIRVLRRWSMIWATWRHNNNTESPDTCPALSHMIPHHLPDDPQPEALDAPSQCRLFPRLGVAPLPRPSAVEEDTSSPFGSSCHFYRREVRTTTRARLLPLSWACVCLPTLRDWVTVKLQLHCRGWPRCRATFTGSDPRSKSARRRLKGLEDGSEPFRL